MNEIRHILVATDLSASSLEAVDRGFLLASDLQAQYTVMHALGLDALSPLRALLGAREAEVSQRLLAQARLELEQAVADATRRHSVVPSLQVEAGLAGDVVTTWAESHDVGLVVVGAHGSGFLQRMLLGSTASRLLRRSRTPVLVVKQEPRGPYKRVLVSLDFSPASLLSIRLARQVAPHADLLLLHVFDVPFEGKMQFAGVDEALVTQYRREARERATRQLHELAASAGLRSEDYTALVLYGDAVREVVMHEERDQCDLIVMGKHGTHVTEELLLGSVTKRVLAESRSDVLVVVDSAAPPMSVG